MDTITRQDRITLKNLKVADFASEETLCFTATVMFHGRPIAEARNDGHGGSTFVRALQGQAALLAQAEEFAKSLPPASLDVEREDDEPYFAKLRSRQDQPIVILAELPADEAFAIWKQHVLGDKPR